MKKIFILSAVISLMFITIEVQAADCSDYKTFSHKWNMCKIGNLPGKEGSNAEVETNSESSTDGGAIKSFWKKIKTFGGKEVGSEG